MDDKCMNILLQYISGPVSWYFFNLNGRMFHFFGDVHFSFEGSCEDLGVKCKKTLNDYNNQCSECFDISFLLEVMFLNMLGSKKLIDFFLEVPYLKAGEKSIWVDPKDNVSLIYSNFRKCFERSKSKCPYENTRFHYADVRQTNPKIGANTEPITLHGTFTNRQLRENLVASILNIIIHSPSDVNLFKEKSEWLNLYFKRFFSTNKNEKPLALKYLESHFENNFNQNIDQIFESFLTNDEKLKYPKETTMLEKAIESIKSISKTSKGRYTIEVHPNKIQLDELRNDMSAQPGMYPKNLVMLIQNFVMKKAEKIISEIDHLWKEQFYKNLIVEIYKNPESKEIADKFYSSYFDSVNIMTELLANLDALILDTYMLARMFRTYSSSKKPTPFADMTITYTGDFHTQNYREFFENVLKVPAIVSQRGMGDAMRCLQNDNIRNIFGEYID